MEVITIDSEAYKDLIQKIDSIADYIRNKNAQDTSEELDEVWVDSYEVCTFLKITSQKDVTLVAKYTKYDIS